MSKHAIECSHAQRERYRCPVCNSGSGREKRPYTSKKESFETASPPTSSPPASSPKVYVGVFQLSTYFDKHIVDRHVNIFASINTHEYICTLCECDTVKSGSVACSARFSAHLSKKQKFLDHLRAAHAGAEEGHIWYPHRCSPAENASYIDPVVRQKADSLA
jgi:hypothetical protein